MKALILIAHGSRRKQSNEEVTELARRFQDEFPYSFDMVHAGFLELAEPDIVTGIQQCIDAGANDVTVLPYFLNSGRHVIEDIPGQVAIARQQNPDKKIHMTAHLGASGLMMEALLQTAMQPT